MGRVWGMNDKLSILQNFSVWQILTRCGGGNWLLFPLTFQKKTTAIYFMHLTFHKDDWQAGLACCSSWGRKESDTTERLNWTELKQSKIVCRFGLSQTRIGNHCCKYAAHPHLVLKVFLITSQQFSFPFGNMALSLMIALTTTHLCNDWLLLKWATN